MKKYIVILFLILPQIIFAELYITPKFNYAFDINRTYNIGNETANLANFIGGGFSLGYRVLSKNRQEYPLLGLNSNILFFKVF